MCDKLDKQFACTTEYPYIEKPEVGVLMVYLCARVGRREREGGGRGGGEKAATFKCHNAHVLL